MQQYENHSPDRKRRRSMQPPENRFAPVQNEADRYGAPMPYMSGKKRRSRQDLGPDKHTGRWAVLAAVAFLGIVACVVMMLPQLAGIYIPGIPAIAFVDREIIVYDPQRVESFRIARDYLRTYENTFFPGVWIDGMDLSGMTLEEARTALTEARAEENFAIQISIGDGTWILDNSIVKPTYDTEALLLQAYAIGRENSATLRYNNMTPMQERLNAVVDLLQHPLVRTSTFSCDTDGIRSAVEDLAAQMSVAPVDAGVASFNMSTRNFTFTQDRDGSVVDADALYTQVMSNIATGNHTALIEAAPKRVMAAVTRSELLNRFCRMAAFSTKTTDNKNRNTNVRLAAEAINGMVVMPDEMFSFNAATGQRTAEKGYKPAAAISGGATEDEIGGGVCQVSSTLFNAVARANLEIVSRSPHAWPSTYVEPGMDATVNWPNLDFKWRNNSSWPVYIVCWYADRHVYVELYGYGLGDGTTIDLVSVKTKTLEAPKEPKEVLDESLPVGTRKTSVQRRDGSVWETYQVWSQNGVEQRRELFCTSTYRAYQETIAYH